MRLWASRRRSASRRWGIGQRFAMGPEAAGKGRMRVEGYYRRGSSALAACLSSASFFIQNWYTVGWRR